MTPIIYNEYSCLLEDDINDQQQHCPGLSCSKDAQRDHFKIIYRNYSPTVYFKLN